MTSGEFFDWQTSGGGGDLGRLALAWREAGVKWCVIGGLAVNHWAREPLITKDADIVVAFSDLTLTLEAARKAEFAPSLLIAPRHENELLLAEWERMRQGFINDPRTIEALEAYIGRSWVRTRRRDTVSSYAVLTWDELNLMPGMGSKKARDLLEMFAAAVA